MTQRRGRAFLPRCNFFQGGRFAMSKIMSTRMSRLTCMTAAMVVTGALSGCVGTGWSWRGRSRETVQAAALPMVAAPQEYQAYADATAQPQVRQQYAGTGGGCGSGSCGSGGSCRTSSVAGPRGVPEDQIYGGAMTETPMAQQNPPAADGYGGQKTCPVTDEALGSMGPPIPVTVKGQTIFVCCQGCVESVQSDPDAYLAKVMRERSGG